MPKNTIRDNDGDELEIDVSGALSTLSRLHIETHKGHAYEVGNIFTGTILDTTKLELLVRVQPNEQIHLAITAQVEARARVVVVEEPTVTVVGTTITPRNLNRHYGDVSSHLWYHTPTYTGGTEMVPQLIPAGDHNKGGGLSGVFVEHNLIPKDNLQTDYVIQLQNISGGTVDYGAIYILYYGVPYSV